MAQGTVTQKLIESHSESGAKSPGSSVSVKIDQTLLQDATGTLVILELLSLGIDRVSAGIAAQYVDHNLIQADSKNPDDHVFLQTASQRLGLHFSRPGNGVSHPVHMAKFAKPGETLLGSDSHTCASGSMGMLAIGSGGLDVAMAMAGEPYRFKMPEICGVHLTGELPDWVSAKDVILELLRRRGVAGGRGKVFEYHGPGLASLSAMDRHVIANMGAELGALTSVFPSDEKTREFLAQQERQSDWREILPETGAQYDLLEEIDLSGLEPLIARPSSPDNVVPVREVEGEPIYQAYVGSSANPGFRDFAVAAEMLKGKQVHPDVSFDISPTSREILENLIASGHLLELTRAGARIHQAGCNGCIGMGQAPATGKNSLRTTPRNFPGRSGTVDDRVWLCSPETAAASAISGRITDPRHLKIPYPKVKEPAPWLTNNQMILPPLPAPAARKVKVIKGPNIKDLVHTPALIDRLNLIVALKVGDNISTDEILPAGARALPFRSNIEKISEFAFIDIDADYALEAKTLLRPHAIVAGENYGQGSSREHAALALVFLGLRSVIAKSYARIHFQNLINFGVVPFTFKDPDDYERLRKNDVLKITGLKEAVKNSAAAVFSASSGDSIAVELSVSDHQREILLAGGLINWKKARMRDSLSKEKPA